MFKNLLGKSTSPIFRVWVSVCLSVLCLRLSSVSGPMAGPMHITGIHPFGVMAAPSLLWTFPSTFAFALRLVRSTPRLVLN